MTCVRAFFRVATHAVLLLAPAITVAAEFETLHRPDRDPAALEDDSAFGRSVDFDADVMAVGAPGERAVYIFTLVDNAWQDVAKIPAPAGAGETFGEQVSVDGERVAVAEPEAVIEGVERAGAVYVYERGETISDWQLRAVFTAPVPVQSGHFGRSVTVRGDRVLVNGFNLYDTAAYLFETNEASEDWTLARTFAGADGSGLAVADSAMHGDRIAFAGGDGYVYEYGSAGWLLTDIIEVGGAEKVALEGDVLVFGAPNEDVGELPRVEGVAYVHERSGGDWERTARLHNPRGGEAYGDFGLRLDLQDGLLLVGEGHETGAVYGYMKNETGGWVDFFEDIFGPTRGMIHFPAVSARQLAIGYAGMGAAVVHLFDVAELMNEADDEAESEDPSGGGEDGEQGDARENDGTGESQGDANAGADADSDTASDDDGNAATENASGEPDTASAGDTGGGIIAWLLLPALALVRRRRNGGC